MLAIALAGAAAGQELAWKPGEFGFPVHNPAPFVVHHVPSAGGAGHPAAARFDPGVRFGDVNGDGRVDLVRAGAYYPAGQSHRVYTNTGSAWRVDRTWTVKTLAAIRAPGFRSLRGAACGVTPGGAQEPVYFARPFAYNAPEAWNDRDGLELPPQNAQLADVNGDGYADVLYAYQVGPTFCAGQDPSRPLPAQRVAGVWLNDRKGRWVKHEALSASLEQAGPVFVVSGLEQFLDATGAWSGECSAGIPPETRSFRKISTAGPCEFAYSYEAGTRLVDLDGDRRLDLISATAGGYAALHAKTREQLAASLVSGAWLNRGDRFEPAPGWRSPVALASRHSGVPADTGVRFADLDGDGRVDLIQGGASLAHAQDADLSHFAPHRVFLNRAGGWCDPGAAGSPCADGRRYLPPVDFIAELDAGQPHAGFASHRFTVGERGVRLADLDGDGRVDLLRADGGPGGRRAWLNRAGGAEPGSAWVEAPGLAPPAGMEFVAEELAPAPLGAGKLRIQVDRGVRLLDIDTSGTPDLVRSSSKDGEGVALLLRPTPGPKPD